MYKVTQALRDRLVELGFAKSTWDADHNVLWDGAAVKAVEAGKLKVAEFNELVEEIGGTKSVSPTDVFGGARVKRPSARYDATKSVGRHSKTGLPVQDERGRPVESVSELEYAKAGTFLKYLAARGGQPAVLREHERDLLAEMFEHDRWAGKIGSEWRTGVSGMEVKALLNDVTSGGADLVPEFFDAAVIQFPLLHSELLPKIDLRDVPRGSAVETASVGNPTVQWGIGEGTPMQPFDTASLVDGIDTSLFPVSVAIEVGKDFLSDAAADVGRVLLENCGQRLLAELDKVIAVGNGTTQPQGIFNASGLNDIGNPGGGAGADAVVGDYERLLFGIGKQYRSTSMRCAFLGNDTTYSRVRGIAVGASDQRRVFGMDHGGYQLLEHPFLISNDVGNAYCAFGALSKYRLYRRAGQQVVWETGGRELSLKNQALLIVRGRFGGRVMDANAFAFSDNWKA